MSAEKLIASILGVLIAVAAYGASAQISISFPEGMAVAPMTGQTLAILVSAHILGWRNGSISVLLYLLLGALGLPVFSNFSSGVDVLFGPTIGYFLGFVLAALIVGLMKATRPPHFFNYFLEMLVGSTVILIIGGIGLLWFLPANEIFDKGILPFLPSALVKILLGAIFLSVFTNVNRLLKQF